MRRASLSQRRDSEMSPSHGYRHQCERCKHVREATHAKDVPIGAVTESIELHKSRVEKRRRERSNKAHQDKSPDLIGVVKCNFISYQVTQQPRTNQSLAAITDKPAQDHQRWNVGINLREKVCGECGK